MGELLIRDLDGGVKRRLEERARDHGVSMEAEARAILTRGVGHDGSRIDRLLAAAELCGGVELELPPCLQLPWPIDLV